MGRGASLALRKFQMGNLDIRGPLEGVLVVQADDGMPFRSVAVNIGAVSEEGNFSVIGQSCESLP